MEMMRCGFGASAIGNIVSRNYTIVYSVESELLIAFATTCLP